MTIISLEWIQGRPSKGAEADDARALAAAKNVFAAFEWRKGETQEIDASEAFEAFKRHISDEDYFRSPRDTILIAAWETAQSAADAALTQGWHNPDGAFIELVCYP